MHRNSYELFVRHAAYLFAPGISALELGPDQPGGKHDLKAFIHGQGAYYRGADYLDEVLSTAGHAMYDVVVAANVMEHVPAPWLWVQSVANVVRPGGHLVLVSPVSWPYHPAPLDCWRAYPSGMRALLVSANLSVTLCETGTGEIEDEWRHEHGDRPVVDCLGIGRKR